MRSLTVGFDLVHEIADLMRTELGNVVFRHVHPIDMHSPSPHGQQLTSTDDLSKVPGWELRLLALVGWADQHEGHALVVHLHQYLPTSVRFNPSDEEPANLGVVAEQVVARLDNECWPRIRWKALAAQLPWVMALLLIAAWVWVLAVERPPASVAVFGSLVTLALMPVAAWTQTWLRGKFTRLTAAYALEPGTRIRTVTRHDLRLDRAQRRRALALAVFTGALGVVGTLLVQHWTGR